MYFDNVFSANGRLNRLSFFILILCSNLIYGFLGNYLLKFSEIYLYILFAMLIVFQSLQIVKRLHDLDRSGWKALLLLVPFANLYIAFLLFFIKGGIGPNKYGDALVF
ncbi:MAG: DUF805 domain-containing protein [Bacillota bacterium]